MIKSKPKIVYLISHGHSARGTFQTGLLEKLKLQGFEIVIIAREVLKEDLSAKAKSIGAELILYSPPVSSLSSQLNILRTYVHQDIRKNPSLWEKYLRKSRDKDSSLKRRLLNRAYYKLGAFIRTNKFLLQKYKNFEKKSIQDNKAAEILKEIKPDMVISTRPMDQQEYFILATAERLNIKKVFYILSWDNITSKGFFPIIADYYLTWGVIMNQELDEYYQVTDSKIYNTGVTHFDIHDQTKTNPELKRWLAPLKLDHKKPFIFFTLSSSYYCPDEIDIIEWLADKIEKEVYGKDMQLLLRPHMHNFKEGLSDGKWKNRLLALQSNRVAIDFPEMNDSVLTWFMKHDDMLKLSNFLNGTIINLNSGSTIALEAALLNKPVILPLFETEELPEWLSVKRLKNYIHLKKLIDLKGVEVVNSFEELDRSIKKYIKNPSLGKEERANAVYQECYINDGKATDRFIKNIQTIINNNIKRL